MSAAAALALNGVPSLVLESRPRLGGRASSFQDNATGQWIDNCQHVSMGCCTNFQHFCETTGIASGFRTEQVLYFVGPNGRIHRFAANRLPAPFHLAGAFAGLTYLSWADKIGLARALRALAKVSPHDTQTSFAEWLATQRQSRRAIDRFWNVVLVSALSETLDRIHLAAGRKVFIDGFLAHHDAWQVSIPRTPLETLYGGSLLSWMRAQNVEIRLLTGVDRLEASEGLATGVVLRTGERVAAGEMIVAVPYQRVADLFPPEVRAGAVLDAVTQLESAPISSIHLWFDRPVMSLPHAVFVQGLVQWIFNRTQLSETKSDAAQGYYYQVVISASRDVVESTSEQVLVRVLDELAAVWPVIRSATLLSSRQVTEHRAVFSMRPGVEALRPSQQSPIANVQLAGDYTRTGWPATMEGAVRSGYLAAENVLARLGRPATIIQPDLPISPLARWLLGLKEASHVP